MVPPTELLASNLYNIISHSKSQGAVSAGGSKTTNKSYSDKNASKPSVNSSAPSSNYDDDDDDFDDFDPRGTSTASKCLYGCFFCVCIYLFVFMGGKMHVPYDNMTYKYIDPSWDINCFCNLCCFIYLFVIPDSCIMFHTEKLSLLMLLRSVGRKKIKYFVYCHAS